jgi:Domain of unknown function (DUF4276)
MVRLYLFAEGVTEQTFADTELKPHLAKFGVYLRKPVLVCTARKKGRIFRGGGRRYLPMKNDISRFLSQEKGSDVFFTTMIDFYALYSDFPGREEAEKLKHLPYEAVVFLEKSFGADVSDPRFIPHLQLHEFEAYLFSDLSCLELFYPEAKQITQLRSIADEFYSPELINDGPTTAPSKRISKVLPDYDDAKTTVGAQAAGLIGLATIRAKCHHFDEWVTRLEELGSG